MKWDCPNCSQTLNLPDDLAGEFRCVCGWTFASLTDPGTPGKITQARGMGDVVAKVAHAVGLRKCGGCEKRQQKLNELMPFHKRGDHGQGDQDD